MQQLLRAALGAVLLALAPACSLVTIDEPFGARVTNPRAADWDGHWFGMDGEARLDVEVRERPDGTPVVTALFLERPASDLDGSDGMWSLNEDMPEPVEFDVRKWNDLYLLHAPMAALGFSSPDPDWAELLIFFAAIEDGQLVVYFPEVEAFAQAVESGQLAGRVQRNDYGVAVSLEGNESAAFDALFESVDSLRYIDFAEPMAFVRMPVQLLSVWAIAEPRQRESRKSKGD